ncbi:hypothetical protein PHPALM_28501 [Phytophthora palmivora]|uniref:MYND-type domain-containing protein n=1 Tax=Phytophthora palmivora TaxID=4796 RepID=A0A2P4X9W8_9STRA|nr:hypothetical protein PHPALM_28501 [Phytophthora palmivora]
MPPSVCSACQATGKKLSRCSQCKWVAYCSKTCQRGHWKDGHRLMCAKLKVCQRFWDLERQWWATRPTGELQTFVVQFGLRPESMSFFGEVLFLLCGLKACVLLSNLPPTWRWSFARDVVVTSGLLEILACSVALYSVSSRLETPAEYQLSGDLVLGNILHSEFPLAERTLRLAAVTVDTVPMRLSITDMNTSGLVQENELARVLDYPVALSECNEDAPMVELISCFRLPLTGVLSGQIGYFLEEGQEQILLTSYCAMATPHCTQRVHQHFQRYRRCSGLQLRLQTSQISDN